MSDSSIDTIRSFCNGCQRDTRHEVVRNFSRQRREGDGQLPRIIDEQWQMLQCCGCESVKVFLKEDSTDFKSPRETHFPARQVRRIPEWSKSMPQQCQDLIHEIYTAMHTGCVTLSAMGTRTLLDVTLLEMLGDIGGFERKLQKAVSNGFFTSEQKDTINTAVEAGHAASHRGFRPTEEQLHDVVDIVEHVLMGQYVLAASSGRLKNSVPGRENMRG